MANTFCAFQQSRQGLVHGPHRGWTLVASAKKQRQQKKQRKRKVPVDQRIFLDRDDEEVAEQDLPDAQESSIPRAPSTAWTIPSQEPAPGDIYQVFPKDPGIAVKDGGGRWSWDEKEGAADAPPGPMWNPRTGFMKTREQVEAEARVQQVLATSSRESQTADFSNTSTSGRGQHVSDLNLSETGANASPTYPSPSASPVPSKVRNDEASLPAVTKGQVLSACVSTSLWMGVIALLIRAYAEQNSARSLGTDTELLKEMLALPPSLGGISNFAILVGTVVLVTCARFALCQINDSFRTATMSSNQQLLTPLSWPDVVLVAGLTGLSEEFLFRGALIPATFLDWRGALISGVLFGALHNSGGRNWTFAAWAGGVGTLYGTIYLYTHNIWLPAAAHALANFCSAAVWITSNKDNSLKS